MKKYESLYRRIKEDIESGVLPGGERLLSIREEAAVSGVSINTVIKAYELLGDEGFLRIKGRGGVFVRSGVLELKKEGIGTLLPPPERFVAEAKETGARLDQLYERLLHVDQSFACAAPGLDVLPTESLCLAASRLNHSWMEYDNPEGDYALRRRLALVNQEMDGVSHPDDIVVTNGATEALTIVLRSLLHPGDTVALESPTYFNYFRQLAPIGVRTVEIPVGEEGMDPELLEKVLEKEKVRMILTQPNVQNPTGISMSDGAKERIIALAEQYSAYLVQDDVYGDLSFNLFRPRNLSSYSDYSGIILVSSYSKSISPGLRGGWIRSSRYAPLFQEEKLRTSMDSCRIAQGILTAYIGTTAHRRHLQNIRKVLESRIRDHIQLLAEILPEGSSVRHPSGGCLLWIALPPDLDATRVFEHSAGKGLIAAPGPLFSSSRFFNHYIRLNAGSKLTPQRSKALAVLGETAFSLRG